MTTLEVESGVSVNAAAEKSGWILFAVCILGVMIQIDFTAVNVALIAIGQTIHANLTVVQWALSAYVLAWGAFVLTAGRCADLFGKRRTFLIGTLLFVLGSLLAGAASQAWFLILGRVIQGIGGGLFLPGLYTLVFTAFPEHKRGFALGVLTSSIAIGLAIGPTFGGVVLHLLNWRWIFFLNLPLGIPVIAIILWAVKREPWRLSAESMDYGGAALIALALVFFMYGLNQVTVWGMGSAKFLITIAVSLILLVIFIQFERRQKHPLIQLDIFRNRIFLGCSLVYVIIGFNFATVLIVGGLYLENALDYSALNTGFIFLTMTVMFGWLSVYGGKWADRMDPRVPIVWGGIAAAVSLFMFSFCTQHSLLWLPMLALGLFGVGDGLVFPAVNAAMMRSVPSHMLSAASGAFTMFGCIGNVVGLVLSSVIILTFGNHRLSELLISQGGSLSADQSALLHVVVGSPHYNAAQLVGFSAEEIPAVLNMLRSSFIHGMFITMLIAMGLAVAGVIISAILIKPADS